jgi:YVTN family beta-propeller protein
MTRRALAPLVALLLLAQPAIAQARNAYVANNGGALGTTVSVFDIATGGAVGSPISVGTGPFALAISPDGSRAYVANQTSGDVSVIDTATNTVVGAPITVGTQPHGVALSPDGSRAYVGSEANPGTVSVIDTQTGTTVGEPIPVGVFPIGLAVTPDGARVYVTSSAVAGGVSVIDTRTGETTGAEIPVGSFPFGIAITPDGARAFVTNQASNSVSVIDTRTNAVIGSPIMVGAEPAGIAIAPDGARAYVGNAESSSVSVIDTRTDQTVGTPIQVGGVPVGLAIDPSGSRVYVDTGSAVSVIDTGTNSVVGSPIPVGAGGRAIAIVPDQPPRASFQESRARPAAPAAFHGVGDDDPDGTNARYAWSFGDGTTLPNGGPDPHHTYNRPGAYKVTLTLTDDEGCSTAFVFTGQTAYCNGSQVATQTQAILVAYPAVRVRCPRRAGRRGCLVRVRAVTKRHRGKAESAVAKARVKAGGAKILPLKTKKAFATRLATARKALVEERLKIHGTTHLRFARLKIVR